MARPPSDDPRSEHVTIRLTVGERAKLDERRGARSLTDYIRGRILGGRS